MKLLGLIEAPEDLVTKEYVDENFERKEEKNENDKNIPKFFSKTYLEGAYGLEWVSIPKKAFRKLDSDKSSQTGFFHYLDEQKVIEVDSFYTSQDAFLDETLTKINIEESEMNTASGNLMLCVSDYGDSYWFITKGVLLVDKQKLTNWKGTSQPLTRWGMLTGLILLDKRAIDQP